MRLPQVHKMPLFRRICLLLPCLSLRWDGPRHRLQNAGLHVNSSVISAHVILMCGVSFAASPTSFAHAPYLVTMKLACGRVPKMVPCLALVAHKSGFY